MCYKPFTDICKYTHSNTKVLCVSASEADLMATLFVEGQMSP